METRTLGVSFVCLFFLGCGNILAQSTDSSPATLPSHLSLDSRLDLRSSSSTGIWKSGIGEGFKQGTHEAGFALGAGFGMKIIGSKEAHDLALGKIHYGWIATDLAGEDHWYAGNLEVLIEGLGGFQYNPNHAYVVASSAVVRYNFMTGTRWVPFLEGGGGIAATDIGHPDLSTTFQFNLTVGAGVHYFWRENSSIFTQYRYFHISNAGIKDPNFGVNSSLFYVGMSWFF
jgi:lipid A 3-O-deacylase